MFLKSKKANKVYSLYSNFYSFFLTQPKIETLVKLQSPEEIESFRKRILQRIGINVNEYSVLNIHKMGIEVPSKYIFEELLSWDGNSSFWPNKIARVSRVNGSVDNILIYILGLKKIKIPLFKKTEIKVRPLFNMSALKIQHRPAVGETDNARYLLYNCSGGYPIGIFCLYVRSSISEENETERSQLFSVVAFDFYGKKSWFSEHMLNPIWQKIHNRVSGNILIKMKDIFEEKFHEHMQLSETLNTRE